MADAKRFSALRSTESTWVYCFSSGRPNVAVRVSAFADAHSHVHLAVDEARRPLTSLIEISTKVSANLSANRCEAWWQNDTEAYLVSTKVSNCQRHPCKIAEQRRKALQKLQQEARQIRQILTATACKDGDWRWRLRSPQNILEVCMCPKVTHEQVIRNHLGLNWF